MPFILYNNKVKNAASISYSGMSSEANMLEPQLIPAAFISGTTAVITIDFDDLVRFDAIGLFGLSESITYTGVDGSVTEKQEIDASILVERTTTNGGAYSALGYDDIDIIQGKQTPFGDKHVVIRCAEQTSCYQLRITISTATALGGTVRALGALFVGMIVESEAIAEFPASFKPMTSAEISASDGGQIFSSSGAAARRFEISHGPLSDRELFGGLKSPKEITSLNVTSVVNASGGGTLPWGSITAGSKTELTFAGVLEPDKLYEFRLKTSVDVAGYCSLSTSIGSTSIGRASVVGFVKSGTDLVVTAYPDTGQRIKLFDFELYEDRSEDATNRDTRQGILSMIEAVGRGQPVAVVFKKETFVGHSNIAYGFVEQFNQYRGRGGNLTGGGFTLMETL